MFDSHLCKYGISSLSTFFSRCTKFMWKKRPNWSWLLAVLSFFNVQRSRKKNNSRINGIWELDCPTIIIISSHEWIEWIDRVDLCLCLCSAVQAFVNGAYEFYSYPSLRGRKKLAVNYSSTASECGKLARHNTQFRWLFSSPRRAAEMCSILCALYIYLARTKQMWTFSDYSNIDSYVFCGNKYVVGAAFMSGLPD